MKTMELNGEQRFRIAIRMWPMKAPDLRMWRMWGRLLDKIELTAEEGAAIGLSTRQEGGGQHWTFDTRKAQELKRSFEFEDSEAEALLDALTKPFDWPPGDRRWLDPIIQQLEEAAAGGK